MITFTLTVAADNTGNMGGDNANTNARATTAQESIACALPHQCMQLVFGSTAKTRTVCFERQLQREHRCQGILRVQPAECGI
jgi:hypothetical protein